MELNKLDDLFKITRGKPPKRIAVAAAGDLAVLEALKQAVEKNLVEPILIGDSTEIERLAAQCGFDIKHLHIYHESAPEKAALEAVRLIHEGKAEILMKGMVSTASLLRAVLNKNIGLKSSMTLSHFALFEISRYHKLLGITDAAMNIAPKLEEKVAIIENAVSIYNGLGYQNPKVAVLAPVEIVNPKIESTTDAALLAMMNRKNQIRNCIIDGPYALDIAISREAALHKEIDHPVAGDADILIAPDLNTGNVLYKSITFLGGGISAAIIAGAKAPIVLTSRSDSEKSKLYSIALASALDH